MSKGSPVVSVRVKPLLKARIDESVRRLTESDRSPVNSIGEWLMEAILEKLDLEERRIKAHQKRKQRSRAVDEQKEPLTDSGNAV